MGIMDNVHEVSTAASKPLWGKAFPLYRGRNVKVWIRDSVTLSNLTWDEGSKSEYVILRADGKQADMRFASRFAPWSNPWEGRVVELSSEIIVIEFWRMGLSKGINIHAHPSLMPKLLPATPPVAGHMKGGGND